jgi:2-iminobutanoate/2-iminopropanoate deaminase
MKEIISTDRAPKAIGPYSQAVVANGFVFLSGQIPLDPSTNQLLDGDITSQTELVLSNMKGLLEACGSTIEQVVKTTVFIKDMGEFAKMNEVYTRYFSANAPARSTVEVARLPRDVKIEIECIATL